jgi:predicted signal transduction protein with EAL and GGDEF domain
VLRRVQEDGVQLSIDDFGTGFSSLSQLKRLTADELKIDQSLTRDVATDPGDAVLVRSAIDLAHNLGLFVTAEGVEDLHALAMLRDLGCDQAQGYGLARPVPAEGLAIACTEAERRARTVAQFDLAAPRRGAKRERHFQHPHWAASATVMRSGAGPPRVGGAWESGRGPDSPERGTLAPG